MNDYQRIESFLTGSSITVLFSVTNLGIFSLVLAVYNVHVFLVFAVASCFYSLWVILFLKTKRKLDYKSFDISARGQSSAVQLVQGMQEIKLNGVERPMRWTWERLQARSFRLKMKTLVLNQWQNSGASLINEGKNVFITFLSAEAVINGQMTLGSMLAIQYIIGQLNSPVDQLLNFAGGYQQAKISMERLNEVHRMEDEEPPHRHLLQELPPAFSRQIAGGNAIVLSNVSFTYPGAGNEPVLKDISLKIPKGKTTAMVGVSGSGKTTLLKLLLKFYEPQKGDIFLDHRFSSAKEDMTGPSLAAVSHRLWRSKCGAVMQDSFIFSGSIAQNIALGEDEPDMERLKHAVHVANIGEFIDSLPLGLNTTIGAEGTGISMGQRQRILIARTVYRDPEFIFLDEATNSLDANNEKTIVENLGAFLENKTVVVVAHRLSTVRHADQIIVLNGGVIAERGTHQELVNLKGIYFTLVRNQLELGE
jgi:ATP-binding cassette subfamily B protein